MATANTEEAPAAPPVVVKSSKPNGLIIGLMGALILALAFGGAVWMYVQGQKSLKSLAEGPGDSGTNAVAIATTPISAGAYLRHMDSWLLQASLTTAVAGVGIFLVVVSIFILWRRSWLRRFQGVQNEMDDFNRRMEEAQSAVQRAQLEKLRSEEELRKVNAETERRVAERTATLASARDALQQELDSRKSAERQLTAQTKELERNKDVLELHVQARTQEVQKLQRRSESILNSAGEGIYGLDVHGKITFANPAAGKLTGLKVEELVGKLESEIFQPVDASSGARAGAEHDANGVPLTEQLFRRKDGASFSVEYVRTPIRERDRDVGAVVIFKDITERKRAEESLSRKAAELARSNAELEQFAYVASHDLQEPLRKIQAFGDRLKTKCDAVNLSEGRDYLERMQNAAARMQTLINDLLTFSRVISASQPFVQVDLNAVTKGVLSDLEVRIDQTKARVEVGQLPSIEGDPLQMRQLLQNLIGNALKFQAAGAQPLVKINAQIVRKPFASGTEGTLEDEICELTIQDNGIGFEEKYLEKIFAVFQRLHGRNEFEGTGVGLAVCRRITDRHGGTITARSKPGEGATFIIHLPVRHRNQPLVAP